MLEISSLQEMLEILGGVTREEYCRTIDMLMSSDYAQEHWSAEDWRNAQRAKNQHC